MRCYSKVYFSTFKNHTSINKTSTHQQYDTIHPGENLIIFFTNSLAELLMILTGGGLPFGFFDVGLGLRFRYIPWQK